MANLIYTRNRNNCELTVAQTMELAPAIFTEHNEKSDRYGQVSTLDAMSVLRERGYVPVQAAQKKARKKSSSEFAQHLVTFTHLDNINNTKDRPEIVLYNSHDGLSSLKLFGGWFRFICSNGVVAGEGFEYKMRHIKTNMDFFQGMLDDVITKLPLVARRIEQMKSVYDFDHERFSLDAAQLRWGLVDEAADRLGEHPEGVYTTKQTAKSLLRVRRVDDNKDDLWTTFNRAQEALIRGGGNVVSFSERNPFGKWRKARPINSVQESLRVNRSLWDIAEDYLMEAA